MTLHQQPLISHLLELRRRLLRSLAAVAALFVVLIYFANDIYHLLALPLLRNMPSGAQMIATDVTTPFMIPMKLTLYVALFVAIPYVLYQIWAFVAPGLYQHERKMVLPLVVASTGLYYLGMLFAYFVVFPMVFSFFAQTAPEGVTMATDIASYLSFIMGMFFAFGLAFEVPVAVCLLCWSGATTPQALAEKRPYFIVGAFVVAMFLTPPDVLSQTLLAVPICLLFELGLLMGRFYRKPAPPEDTP
ncbi:MAG: twin-arginine translocase subunit TatC [Aeromonadaceae bacterium]|jgi:sec-independent protein translocase protein TatC|nr:twin-arginine translocase subunit TatC [Aeromonadaceae bacterium]